MIAHSEVQIEDVPDCCLEIVETIGLENFLKLSGLMGGDNFYFPKIEFLTRPALYRQIQNEYNGSNIRDIGRKYGKSARWIRQILKRKL